MKAWKLALAGVVALSGATGGYAQVTSLGASASIMAADDGDFSERMLVQTDGFADYVKSGYVASTSGRWVTGEQGAPDVHSRSASPPSARMRANDTGMILLIGGGLVAYQLRRKQQLLERSPIST
jgi:hypothetical protein